MCYGRAPAIEAAGSGFPLQSFEAVRLRSATAKGFSLASLAQIYNKP